MPWLTYKEFGLFVVFIMYYVYSTIQYQSLYVAFV